MTYYAAGQETQAAAGTSFETPTKAEYFIYYGFPATFWKKTLRNFNSENTSGYPF